MLAEELSSSPAVIDTSLVLQLEAETNGSYIERPSNLPCNQAASDANFLAKDRDATFKSQHASASHDLFNGYNR